MTARIVPGVPYHIAQATDALNAGSLAIAQVHAQLAIADATERQTKILAAILERRDT